MVALAFRRAVPLAIAAGFAASTCVTKVARPVSQRRRAAP